mmetsp:Transcript_34306/g.98679  ORF Transcript_34306/g.98679 Transcript_34306/m.98679 type:complete len:230 (-) Transcript_34306:106-795(-)
MTASRLPQLAAASLRRHSAPGRARPARAALLALALSQVLRAAVLTWVPPGGQARREAASGQLDASSPLLGRRGVLAGALAAAGRPAWAEEQAAAPLQVEYERLVPGTDATGPRNGPPKYASRIWLRYTAHVDGFEGPIYDSSYIRGQRKPSRESYIETTVNVDGSMTPGMWDAVKRMKVGEKGRFVQPPALSYNEGKTAFEGDEDGQVKKIPANATLYYNVELVNIIRP